MGETPSSFSLHSVTKGSHKVCLYSLTEFVIALVIRCVNTQNRADISYRTYGMDLVLNLDEIVPAVHERSKPRRD